MENILGTIKRDFGFDVNELTNVSYFNKLLPQSGIDKYNKVIGGYFDENNKKIQGLNEYINLYNQQLSKKDKNKKIAKLKMMYKQILTPSESGSFYIDAFEQDDEVIETINNFYKMLTACDMDVFRKSVDLFDGINNYNLNGKFIKNEGYISCAVNKSFP